MLGALAQIGRDHVVSVWFNKPADSVVRLLAHLIIVSTFASEWDGSWAEIFPDERALRVLEKGRSVSRSCLLYPQHSFCILPW